MSREAIAQLLSAHAGLMFGLSRYRDLDEAIGRGIAREGVAGPEEYLRLLEVDADALRALVAEVTVGETYFFRDPAVFTALREEILPRLAALPDGLKRRLRAWSAGCSSGEEAWSIAILFEELGLTGSHVLGTDISILALAKARRAIYRPWSLRSTEAGRALPYLQEKDELFAIKDKLRKRVTFAWLNLLGGDYPSLANGTAGLELILCRNVLIYLHPAACKEVAQRLYASLAEGGILITGPSDPPLAEHAPFEQQRNAQGVFFYRRPGAALLRPRAPPPAAPALEARPAPVAKRRLPEESVRPPAKAGQVARPRVPPPPVAGPSLASLEAAFVAGDYAGVLARTLREERPQALELRIKALANLGRLAEAERVAAEATVKLPLSIELHYLRAALAHARGNARKARGAAERALYLDRSLAVVHFLLGLIAWDQGAVPAARRSFRNAQRLCRGRPPDEPLALGDGQSAGNLLVAATSQIKLIDLGRRRGDPSVDL